MSKQTCPLNLLISLRVDWSLTPRDSKRGFIQLELKPGPIWKWYDWRGTFAFWKFSVLKGKLNNSSGRASIYVTASEMKLSFEIFQSLFQLNINNIFSTTAFTSLNSSNAHKTSSEAAPATSIPARTVRRCCPVQLSHKAGDADTCSAPNCSRTN